MTFLVLTFLACAVILFLARRLSQALDSWIDGVLRGDGHIPAGNAPASTRSVLRTRPWLWGGAAFVIASLVFLEFRDPYYFTQADVLVTELPGILTGCRNLWNGVFPDYNPYPFMGSPLASTGAYSLTYPPLWFSYALARHLLVDEYATMEVFALIHIAAGYFATYAAARLARLSPMAAALAGLAFALSGGVLVMGRSWHAPFATVAWMPVLAAAVMRLAAGPVSWRWAAWTGLALGLFYHAGYSQFWIYSCLFLGLAVVWLFATGRIPAGRLLFVIPACMIGIGIAMPLVLQQLRVTEDLVRSGGHGSGIVGGVAALVIPAPLTNSPPPNGWATTDVEFGGEFYSSGTVLVLVAAMTLLALVTTRPRRALLAEHPWIACGLAAFLLALGHDATMRDLTLTVPFLDWLEGRSLYVALAGAVLLGLAWHRRRKGMRGSGVWTACALFTFLLALVSLRAPWTLLGTLPVFDRINNHPFRLVPFLVLFAALGGGLVLTRLLNKTRRRRWWEIGIAAAACGLVGWHVVDCRTSFYTFGFRPYPELPPAMADLLAPGSGPAHRIVAWSPNNSIASDFGLSLAAGMPALHGLFAFHGYDPVARYRPATIAAIDNLERDPLAAVRAYGIGWVVKHRVVDEPELSPNPAVHPIETSVEFGRALAVAVAASRKVLSLPHGDVYEVPGVDPLAFPEGHPERPLPVRANGSGIDVDVAGSGGGKVVVNFLRQPEMMAFADGVENAVGEDGWGRVVVDARPGVDVVHVRFTPQWLDGILPALVLVFSGFAGAVAAAARRGCYSTFP